MSIAPKWRGSKKLKESPESPDADFVANRITCVRTYNGPYAVCLNSRPKYGATMPDLPAVLSKLRVVSCKVKKASGGRGVLTVNLEYMIPYSEMVDTPDEFESQPEIDWLQVERPLLTNKFFAELSAGELVAIEAWRTSDELELKQAFKYRDKDGVATELSTLAKKAAEKFLKGVETWIDFIPVVRTSQRTRRPPIDGNVGGVSTAGEIRRYSKVRVPAGYKYLKTADRGTRSESYGRWAREMEFTGATEWDEDLYPKRKSAV